MGRVRVCKTEKNKFFKNSRKKTKIRLLILLDNGKITGTNYFAKAVVGGRGHGRLCQQEVEFQLLKLEAESTWSAREGPLIAFDDNLAVVWAP